MTMPTSDYVDRGGWLSHEFKDLSQGHLDHLLSSGISVEVVRERGYRTVLGKLILQEAGFSPTQQRPGGLLIPLHSPDGAPAGHLYRPDRPRLSGDRAVKYEMPRGAALHFDVPPRCKQDVRNPKVPIWITEGAKKADALASIGQCAINLNGVYGFLGKNEFGGKTLLPDWDLVAWNGRDVYLCFDSDIIVKREVKQALERLSQHLEMRSAQVWIVRLPMADSGDKVGVDDYLAAGHNIEDVLALTSRYDPIAEQAAQLNLQKTEYTIHEGCFCVVRDGPRGRVKVPLCNFSARIAEEIIEDDGLEEVRRFAVDGVLANGARIGEACNLERASFMPDADLVRIKGKTGERIVPVSRLARHMVLALPGDKPFPYHIQTYSHWVSAAFRAVGLQGSAHSLRHTFCSLWKGDIISLRAITGHTSVQMLENYRHRKVEEAARQHVNHSPLALVNGKSKSRKASRTLEQLVRELAREVGALRDSVRELERTCKSRRAACTIDRG